MSRGFEEALAPLGNLSNPADVEVEIEWREAQRHSPWIAGSSSFNPWMLHDLIERLNALVEPERRREPSVPQEAVRYLKLRAGPDVDPEKRLEAARGVAAHFGRRIYRRRWYSRTAREALSIEAEQHGRDPDQELYEHVVSATFLNLSRIRFKANSLLDMLSPKPNEDEVCILVDRSVTEYLLGDGWWRDEVLIAKAAELADRPQPPEDFRSAIARLEVVERKNLARSEARAIAVKVNQTHRQADEDLAGILDIKVGALRTRLTRARKKFEEHM